MPPPNDHHERIVFDRALGIMFVRQDYHSVWAPGETPAGTV